MKQEKQPPKIVEDVERKLPFSEESILLDHYAGLAMQPLISKYTLMIPGSGGASEVYQPPLDSTQLARTAYRIAEEMILERRDAHRRLSVRDRKEETPTAALMYDVDQ